MSMSMWVMVESMIMNSMSMIMKSMSMKSMRGGDMSI